jgi:hypothetical protein
MAQLDSKGEWTYEHLMSVNGKFDHVQRDDLTRQAQLSTGQSTEYGITRCCCDAMLRSSSGG